MELAGKCKKLRVYVDEDLKHGNVPLYHAILEILLKEGVAGATVFRGYEGFGSSHHIHTPRIIELTEKLPRVVEVVEKPHKLLKALNQIEEILPVHCLVTIENVEVLHYYHPNGKHAKTKSLD
jgi:PII-like signaling protein